jgi:hypothetical protein
MERARARQILQEIQEECKSKKHCEGCKFYIGEGADTLCVFNADPYEGLPENWEIEELPNIK